MVVVVDNEDRENEGDLITAASLAESASIALMVRRNRRWGMRKVNGWNTLAEKPSDHLIDLAA